MTIKITRSCLSIVLCAIVQPAHSQTAPAHDNAELAQLFDADQGVRMHMTAQQGHDPAFIGRMVREDAERRARTRQLVDAGTLITADDFYHAAFIFQHGGATDDYLLAHSLALAAAALGKKEAAWIAAATLDRYLQKIGQKQIYGTQFSKRDQSEWTMEPYDRALVPDTLRRALGVPPQAQQEVRLAKLKSGDAAGK